MQRVPWVSPAVVLILALFYALEARVGALDSWDQMVALGALVHADVEPAEFHRFATANLLHLDLFHLLANSLGLLTLGSYLEWTIGSSRHSILLVCSALGGSVGSLVFGITPALVGASTMVFGVFAAWLVVILRYPEAQWMPPRLSISAMLAMMALWSADPLVDFRINHGAHAGGFIAGAITMLALSLGTAFPELSTRASTRLRLASLFSTAAFGTSVALGQWTG